MTSLCQRQGGGEAGDGLVQRVDHDVEEDLGCDGRRQRLGCSVVAGDASVVTAVVEYRS